MRLGKAGTSVRGKGKGRGRGKGKGRERGRDDGWGAGAMADAERGVRAEGERRETREIGEEEVVAGWCMGQEHPRGWARWEWEWECGMMAAAEAETEAEVEVWYDLLAIVLIAAMRLILSLV